MFNGVKTIKDIRFRLHGYYPFPNVYFTAANRSESDTRQIFNLMKDNFIAVVRFDFEEENLPCKSMYQYIVSDDLDFCVHPHTFVCTKLYLAKEKLTQEQIDYLELNLDNKFSYDTIQANRFGTGDTKYIKYGNDEIEPEIPKEYQMEFYMAL